MWIRPLTVTVLFIDAGCADSGSRRSSAARDDYRVEPAATTDSPTLISDPAASSDARVDDGRRLEQPLLEPDAEREPLSEGTVRFLRSAASGGEMEIELGRIAAQRSEVPRVRGLGERMVEDHTKVSQDLRAVARRQGLMLPQPMNPEHQGEFQRIASLRGRDFDEAYVRHMLTAHERGVAEFERMARDAEEPEVRAFAQRTVPTLREHLERIRQIATEMGIEGTYVQPG